MGALEGAGSGIEAGMIAARGTYDLGMRELELLEHVYGRNAGLPGRVIVPPGVLVRTRMRVSLS